MYLSKKEILKITLISTALIFFYSLDVNAATAHPRIWIDNNIKTRLQQDVVNNTTEWQNLKQWCDTELGNNLPASYQGMGWHKYVMNYGLCYQATGNQSYGNEGVVYLKALLRDKINIGDGLGGTTAIQTDSGWVARTFGAGVAVGRDWLDGSTDLTPTIIQECRARLDDWISWYETNGFGRYSPADNYYAGYFTMMYTAGFAFEGDDLISDTWKSSATTMWSNVVLPFINGYLNGGDWQEGWNYGEWASREYLQYPHALYTSNGSNIGWESTDWNKDIVKSKLHMLYPGGFYSSDDGSWSGSLKGNPAKTTLLFISQATPISSEEKGLISWLLKNLSWDPYEPNKWEAFLWPNTTPPITPTSSNMGGLSYLITGTSKLLGRSDVWANSNATLIEFSCPPTGNISQGERNVGEFKIASRGELLVVDSDTWQSDSTYGNVLLIEGSHTYAPSQEWWRDNVLIDKYEDSNGFVYARGSHIENAYDGNLDNNPSASFYSREVIFVHPDYIFVMDSVIPTTPETNTITSQINFMGEPTIIENKTAMTNDNATIFMDIRGHNVTISKTDRSDKRSGVWKTDISPQSTELNYKLLHVFQTADSTTPEMDTVTDIIADKVQGVQIGESVVLFNKSPSLIDITGNIVYNIPGTASSHIITGLTAGETYSIEINGNNIFLNSAGTDFAVSSKGVLYISGTGTGTEPETPQNAPNILEMSHN